MNENEKTNSKIVAVNICWIIALLILIIVLLLTYGLNKIHKVDILIESITNFSTILSIILSISSILFAYYTSHDTSMQYRSMEKALGEVRVTNKHMEKNNYILLQQVKDLAVGINTINVRMQYSGKSNTTSSSNVGLGSSNNQIKSNEKNNITQQVNETPQSLSS